MQVAGTLVIAVERLGEARSAGSIPARSKFGGEMDSTRILKSLDASRGRPLGHVKLCGHETTANDNVEPMLAAA